MAYSVPFPQKILKRKF